MNNANKWVTNQPTTQTLGTMAIDDDDEDIEVDWVNECETKMCIGHVVEKK